MEPVVVHLEPGAFWSGGFEEGLEGGHEVSLAVQQPS